MRETRRKCKRKGGKEKEVCKSNEKEERERVREKKEVRERV